MSPGEKSKETIIVLCILSLKASKYSRYNTVLRLDSRGVKNVLLFFLILKSIFNGLISILKMGYNFSKF